MSARTTVPIAHLFVTSIPRQLDPCVLYVSIEHATCVHACVCGCGGRVVTPLSPDDWRLTYDGDTVSLWPSIGNWAFDCRSHYWIKGDRAIWSGGLTDEQIAHIRARQQKSRERFWEREQERDR
jgi:hypothetical protein